MPELITVPATRTIRAERNSAFSLRFPAEQRHFRRDRDLRVRQHINGPSSNWDADFEHFCVFPGAILRRDFEVLAAWETGNLALKPETTNALLLRSPLQPGKTNCQERR